MILHANLGPETPSPPFRKVVLMKLSLLLRNALMYGGEAIDLALGTSERQLLVLPNDAFALACKAVLLIQQVCHSRALSRDSYVPTAIGLLDEALQANNPRNALVQWTVGMGLCSLPLGWRQADRATTILCGALKDPALMRWQQLFGLSMLTGLYQDREQTKTAHSCYAKAQLIDPEQAQQLFTRFMAHRKLCEALP
jgi:hypothetical protein